MYWCMILGDIGACIYGVSEAMVVMGWRWVVDCKVACWMALYDTIGVEVDDVHV